MTWRRYVDPLFPVIEPFTPAERAAMDKQRQDELDGIAAEDWSPEEARALDEAQRIWTWQPSRDYDYREFQIS